MKHIRQKPSQCLLAAICCINPALNYEDLAPGYARAFHEARIGAEKGRWQPVIDYIGRLAPYMQTVLASLFDAVAVGSDADISTGCGVVIIQLWEYGRTWRHALAYEDGLLYDPDSGYTYPDIVSYLWAVQDRLAKLVGIYPAKR